jgi:octaprenyl-diphosphate synthase
MSEGEVMQIAATGNADLSVEDYYTIAHKKTASFVAGCCRCGAILAHARPIEESALAEYGCRLGMAFQIADDLLDYTGEPQVTGKPRGSDLRDGHATLPFLIGLKSTTSRRRSELLAAFGDPGLDDDGVLACCRILADCDAFELTRSAAREQVSEAEAAIAVIPPSPAVTCFTALNDYVIWRDR